MERYYTKIKFFTKKEKTVLIVTCICAVVLTLSVIAASVYFDSLISRSSGTDAYRAVLWKRLYGLSALLFSYILVVEFSLKDK